MVTSNAAASDCRDAQRATWPQNLLNFGHSTQFVPQRDQSPLVNATVFPSPTCQCASTGSSPSSDLWTIGMSASGFGVVNTKPPSSGNASPVNPGTTGETGFTSRGVNGVSCTSDRRISRDSLMKICGSLL